MLKKRDWRFVRRLQLDSQINRPARALVVR